MTDQRLNLLGYSFRTVSPITSNLPNIILYFLLIIRKFAIGLHLIIFREAIITIFSDNQINNNHDKKNHIVNSADAHNLCSMGTECFRSE